VAAAKSLAGEGEGECPETRLSSSYRSNLAFPRAACLIKDRYLPDIIAPPSHTSPPPLPPPPPPLAHASSPPSPPPPTPLPARSRLLNSLISRDLDRPVLADLI